MSEVRRILFVRTDAPADNVLAAGMLPLIKEAHPGAKISVVCQERAEELYEHCPAVDRVLAYDPDKLRVDQGYADSIVETLRQGRFDLSLNTVYSRDPLNDKLALGSEAKERVAFAGDLCNISGAVRDGNNAQYTKLVETGDEWKTEVDHHKEYLTAIGIEVPSPGPAVWTSAKDESYAEKLFTAHGLDSEKTIVVFPGASDTRFAYRDYTEVLSEFTGYSLVVLGTLSDLVRAGEICFDFPGKAINLAGRTTLRQMASVIRRSGVYLGSDSAAVHMACAVGTRNVVIVGGGHFGRFVPYSPLTAAVALPLECYRCNWKCPYPGRVPCVGGIAPEVVVKAMHLALAGEHSVPQLVVHQEPMPEGDAPLVPAWQDCSGMLCAPTEVISVKAGVARESGTEATASQDDLIAVDAIFFQWANTGIARTWRALLRQWSENGFGSRVVVFDRENSAPRFPGIRYRVIPRFPIGGSLDSDCDELERICREEGASLFTSTYYTFPRETASVFFAYDMIPEATGMDLSQSDWERKRLAIQHASSYIAISQSTADDLARLHPGVDKDAVTVAHCGLDEAFFIPPADEVMAFRSSSGAPRHFYVYVGSRTQYKNAGLLFDAFTRITELGQPGLLFVGGAEGLESEFMPAALGRNVIVAPLDDNQLRVAYAAATALVFPSRYEGFGLPVLEAMACGCPVITCRNSSIPEVAGDAAIYVDADDPDDLARAMVEVTRPEIRQHYVEQGLKRAALFKWSDMADGVARHLQEALGITRENGVD